MTVERIMCDECGGEMIFTGQVLNPNVNAMYVHRCKKCGEIDVYSEKYPHEVGQNDAKSD